MKSVLVVSFVVALMRPGFAQDAAPQSQDPVEKARAAYQEVLARREKGLKEVEEIKNAAKQYGEKSKERYDLGEKAKAAQKDAKAPFDPFVAVFLDTDWTKFDPTKDKQLLRDGLVPIATKPSYGEKAIAAGRMYVKLFPDDRASSAILARMMPMTMLALDRADEAVAELRSNADGDKDVRAMALVLLADIEGIRGNFDVAKKALADASALGGKATAEIAVAKAAVVGKPAPAIDTTDWIGAAPIPMADLKGKVVLLGFFATWAPPARTALTLWNRLRDENLDNGLVCIGVAKVYPHGYLPADETQIDAGGTSRQGMQRAEYLEHLQRYHTNTRQHLPFAVISNETFDGYGVKPVPTAVVLDRETRIALVATRLQDEELVRFAIRHLGKTK